MTERRTVVMKVTTKTNNKIKLLVSVIMACMVMFTAVNYAFKPSDIYAENNDSSQASDDSTADVDAMSVISTSKDSTEKETTDSTKTDYIVGNSNDIKIEGVNTQSAAFNGVAGIAFTATLDERYLDINNSEIKSVRPKADTSVPFVMDNAMYAITIPNPEKPEEKKSLYSGFVFNVKGDVKTAYYPIAFEIEYIKDGVTYRVEKSIDIALYGNETETTSASDTATSVPRIIVTGFETNPEKVHAGEQFELTVHLKNTSNKTAVSNIKVTLSSANNEFLPTSGSSTQFVRSMSCGATTDIVMKMEAQGSLEQKPYVLAVKCEYEGEKNAAYTADENISIPVFQEAKLKVTDLEVSPMSLETYSQANVMFNINNTGKSTLYNVQVCVDPDNKSVQSDDSFVGNINPGNTGYADFMVTGIAPTQDDGKVKIIISYEDASGNPGTYETETEIFVYDAVYDEPIYDGEFTDPGMYEEPKAAFPWAIVIAGLVVVIVVIVVTVVVIKKKKKKALEEELEDEIS